MVCASDEVMSTHVPYIGQRVECSGYYGTLLFIGELPPTEGVWLGVDWDEPSRGKHNGSHNGVTYFKTRHPTSGSFVRMNKVNFGVDCVTAIHNRYGEVKDDDTAGIDKEAMADARKGIGARLFEVVGFSHVNKKQSDFGNILVAFLKQEYVNGAGPAGGLLNLCPNIKELDISKNLLNSWEAVAEITQQLLALHFLNVSENRLTLPADPSVLQESFKILEHIVCSRMEYTWSDVLTCSKMWPQIQVIQAAFNRISILDNPPDTFLNVKSIDLQGNPIQDWEEIIKLGELPRLGTLNVASAKLTEIHFPTVEGNEKTHLFPALKVLFLSENRIREWKSVNELNKLKNLEELRILFNPLLHHENSETNRELIIARIANLKKLNGVEITLNERKGAEYDYLKRYGQGWLEINSKGGEESLVHEFLLNHPRYASLIQKYGTIEEGEVDGHPRTLKMQLITVEISSPKVPDKIFKRKLPINMPVQKLQGMVSKLFCTGGKLPTLKYISFQNPTLHVDMDNQLKELSYYSIEDGDRIVVNWS